MTELIKDDVYKIFVTEKRVLIVCKYQGVYLLPDNQIVFRFVCEEDGDVAKKGEVIRLYSNEFASVVKEINHVLSCSK